MRRFIEVQLTEPLGSNVEYYAEVYVSLLDSVWYGTRNLGLHFSHQPHSENVNNLFNVNPQVEYTEPGFLDDKVRWMRISGNFVAEGGERYLAIGNFDSDIDTDTVFVPGGGNGVLQPESFWHASVYFIDDVSVIPDSIYLSNDDIEQQGLRLNLYPNPNAGEFIIDLNIAETDRAVLNVWNLSGQRVLTSNLTAGSQSIQLLASQGLYLYTVTINGELKWTGKLSISSN